MFKKVSKIAIVLLGLLLVGFGSFLKEGNYPLERPPDFDTNGSLVVLELFTSQGCSSCPSADALLQKVKREYPDEVFALSYHVDYWDYIGWKDPFSNSKYAEKQRKYNIKFKNRSNYTPQLVVNGAEHFVGSSSSKVYRAIAKFKGRKAVNHVVLTHVKVKNPAVTFEYKVKGTIENKSIRAILVLDERTTSVKRGENRNRILKNTNIVIADKTIALDSDVGMGSITIPDSVKSGEKISLFVLVENDANDITGAGKTLLVKR